MKEFLTESGEATPSAGELGNKINSVLHFCYSVADHDVSKIRDAQALEAPPTKTLDQKAVERGVLRVLTDSYDIQNVSDVTCPADEPVTTGHTFTCSVVVNGSSKTVTIKVIDDEGTYEVSKPQ
ncbi:hypothetical protein SMNI109538_03990 [Smaragdicoccus niigatensis]